MAIYDINGDSLSSVYGMSGSQIGQAYDIDGNPLMSEPAELVVMTYNIQWCTGINANETMQASILSEYNADIIGLQEVRTGSGAIPEPMKTLLENSYDYIYQGNQNNKTAFASKLALSDVYAHLFDTGTRGYQRAYFAIGNKNICWINTHLETSTKEEEKVAQAAEVYALVQNEPYFIITGDFNTVCLSVDDTEYTTIMKQFVDAGYNTANCSEQHGFIGTYTSGHTAGGTWYPNDMIITSANISIDSVVADQTKIAVAEQTSQAIDHIPLVAYLTIH